MEQVKDRCTKIRSVTQSRNVHTISERAITGNSKTPRSISQIRWEWEEVGLNYFAKCAFTPSFKASNPFVVPFSHNILKSGMMAPENFSP